MTKGKKKPPDAPPLPDGVMDLEMVANQITAAARAEAAKFDVEVITIVVSPAGSWRANWGSTPADRAAFFVFRTLTALQRLI